MANIRIKDLANTAASTASDDFLGVDGTTNGTRKLSAFSPTFGGNATVGGTLTVSGTTASTTTSTGALVVSGGVGVAGAINVGGTARIKGSSHTLRLRHDTPIVDFSNTAETAYVTGTIIGSTLQLWGNNGTGLIIGTTGNATFAGNLTVSGTGTSSFAGRLFGISTPSPDDFGASYSTDRKSVV